MKGKKGMIRLVDTHVHWDQFPEGEWDAIVARSKKAGVMKVVGVGTGIASCNALIRAKQRFPDFLDIAFGFHPEQTVNWEEVNGILGLIREHRALLSGVGEVGLPWYSLAVEKRKEPADSEFRGVLEQFLQLAVEMDLPVLLHAVHHRAEEAFQMLCAHRVQRAVFHWIKAPERILYKIADAGYMVSVTPEVCYRDRDRRWVRGIPISSLLLETDAPWRYGGPFRGAPSDPAAVRRVAEAVSQVRQASLLEVATQTTANATRLFNPY
ncbi:TatD family hydrolase [Melghirimyces algeriensis]|uniref:TatD DNase family protein n=1 Tax=Melghirimyces algeriensis TaxID=910412 RepID=A0A521DMU4_9BACL|nr:TatD family hydrolase [Melghirimyces algeriensis]SMO73023.1 TatD DNase family protein [Melghirimyces algeriensis]